jgi:phosphoribosyl 1,2-cyclic phosphodiesterase
MEKMSVTFLGTAAANAYPEAFCRCDNCEQARALGGPSLRKRSSLLINDDLLIDLGPDIMTASNMHGHPLFNVRYCLQTHGHADHLDTSHFLSRSPGYGVVGAHRLHFYASPGTMRLTAQLLERDCAPLGFLDPEMGERLTLEQGFHRRKLQFDLVILDHTYGPDEPGSDHLSAHQLIVHVARMREEGLLTNGARVFATHIAHEGNPVHQELVGFAARHGYEIAYDGLTV